MKRYAFTLRRTTQPKTADELSYLTHCDKLVAKGCKIINQVFEYKHGLHMHGTMDIPEKQNQKVFRFRGWRFHLVEIYDEARWNSYCRKEQKPQDEDWGGYEEFNEPIEDALQWLQARSEEN
jgi:hypothetical protein